MKRLSVVILERDERAVLRGLGEQGAVHLVRTAAGPETAPRDPLDRSAELQRCDALLARIDGLVRRLEMDALPEPPETLPEMALDQVEAQVGRLEQRAEEVLQTRADVLQRWGRVTALLDQVSAYEGLELSFDQIGRFSFLHFAIGAMPEENLPRLQEEVGPNVVLLPMTEADGRQRLVAVTSRKGRFALETALEKAGFARDTVAEAGTATMSELLEQARREKEQLSRELAQPKEALEALTAEVAQPLAVLRAVLGVERKLLDAEQNFPRTDSTVLVTGWVPSDDVPSVRRRMQDLVGGRCVVQAEDPDDVPDAEIPVLLRHPRLLRPFELLVTGYGLPGYRELEPTLFVAITFLVMFGMMFGDVGHGCVLIVGGLAAIFIGRSERASDIGVLLIFAGLASVAFGFVYGEYFGMHGPGLWHTPLAAETTMTFMGVAIAVGIGVITLGLVLNVVNRFRQGDVLGGILDRAGVVGGVFYWASIVLVLRWAIQHRSDLNWLLGPTIGLALVALIIKEPLLYALYRRQGKHHHADSFGEAVMESGIEVFETILGYLANTISFVRLAAYAMSHAAILLATFLLADAVAEATGSMGGMLRIVVIILGNILAILLEGIIASVQALRLEYYEFFGKFFSGSGRAFTPFRISSHNTKSSS
jgi:V/A-type H+-transporting ATPase subunit I